MMKKAAHVVASVRACSAFPTRREHCENERSRVVVGAVALEKFAR
jgi:hypothetical protein